MAAATQALPSAQSRNLLDNDMSSNVSSPLSEVEDKDGQTPDEAMSVNEDAIEREDESDSDSNLSDVAETEAETERLYDTPRNERYRDVIVDQYNDDHVYERHSSAAAAAAAASSRLRRPANAYDDNDDGELSELDRPSPMSQLTINETPTKDPSRRASPAGGGGGGAASRAVSRGLKRGRTPEHDVPIVVEPASDRHESEPPVLDEDIGMADDDGSSLPPPSSAQSAVGDADDVGNNLSPPLPDKGGLSTRETRGSRKNARTRSRRSTVGPPDDDDGMSDGANGKGHDDDDDDADARGRHMDDADHDAEAEHVDKSAAEERKQAAFEEWTSIDGMFGVFADRLYKDRLAKLEEEERSLLADEPTHPEYLAMMRCLDERLDKKLEQSKREHEFQMAATARVDHAQRGQIWSQFFQEIRDARESALESLNQQWYDVQAARRSAHGSHTDQVLLYPKDPAQRTRNAMSYSAEVSALAAVAKHEGFPAAPAMRGATAAETDSDLEAIRRAMRPRLHNHPGHPGYPGHHPAPQQHPAVHNNHHHHHHQLTAAPLALDSFPATTGLLSRDMGPAGEQFIRDNAWANPRHPAHKSFGPGASRIDGRSKSPYVGGHSGSSAVASASRQAAAVFGGPPSKPSTAAINGIGSAGVSPTQPAPHGGPSEPRVMGGGGGGGMPAVSRPGTISGRAPASPIPDLSRPTHRLPAARS